METLTRLYTLTMTQSNPTGDYVTFENVSQRRDYMRLQAILMLENLNDVAMGTDIRYAIMEDRKNDGYMIVEADHPTTWVWCIISL